MNVFTLAPSVLGAVLLAAIVATIIIYLLNPPILNRVVASNLIWRRVIESARVLHDRWRWWLSLLLALLIIIMIIASAGRLSFGTEGSDRILVVLDNSPSMAALTDSGETRFALAQDAAASLIRSYSNDVPIMIVDTQRQIITPSFQPSAAAIEEIEKVTLSDGLDPIVPSAVANVEVTEKFVFTDGVLLGSVPDEYEVISFFKPIPNIGITKFSFSGVPGDLSRREALVELMNAGGEEQVVKVELSQKNADSLITQIRMAPFEVKRHVFDASRLTSGPAKVTVIADDDGFDADDTAFSYVATKRNIRVGLITSDEQSSLYSLLPLVPRVDVTKVTQEAIQTDQAQLNFDVLIYEGVAVTERPKMPAIIFGLSNGSDGSALTKSHSSQLRVNKSSEHEILEGVSLTDLVIGDTFLLADRVQGKSLFDAEGEGVVAVVTSGDPRTLLFGFNVRDSNLRLLADFPILLSNALTWLVDEPELIYAKPGAIQLPFNVAQVFALDGESLEVWHADNHAYIETAAPGLYTAFSSEGPLRISVSNLEVRYSNVNNSRLSNVEFSDLPTSGGNRYSLPLILAFVAFGLLLIEWGLYHRRITQ